MSAYDDARQQWIETGDPAWLQKMADALPGTREARMAAAGVPWIDVDNRRAELPRPGRLIYHAARCALGWPGFILWGLLFARRHVVRRPSDGLVHWCDYGLGNARWIITGPHQEQLHQTCSRCLVYGLRDAIGRGPLKVTRFKNSP